MHNPAKLAAALSGIQVLPHYLVVLIWPSESALYGMMGGRLEPLLAQFGILYSLAVCALLFGIKVGSGARSRERPINMSYEPNYFAASLISLVIYLLSMYVIILNSGGLGTFLSQAGTQSDFQDGLGILGIFKVPAAYLAILFMAVQYARTGRPGMLLLIVYILLIVLLESTLGSRRAPIQYIIFAIVAIYMLRPDQKLPALASIFLGGMCIVIFVALLNIRDQSSGFQDSRGVLSYIVNFSYNDIYMFVIYHFSHADLWYGKVFLDFQYRFTGGPMGLAPPSLDEGVYIYNLFLGYPVEPPLPIDLMAANSWPPRTFGNGYMNFGIPGVVAFSFIQGYLTGLAYRMMNRSDRHPIFIFLFLLFIFSFQVSNLKLTELIAVSIGLTVIFGPMYLIERNSRRNSNLDGGGR